MRWLVAGRIVRVALLAFLVSRGLLFLLLVVGSQVSFLGKVYGNSVWETRVDLQSERTVPELVRVVMVGDAWWYRSIALEGYVPRTAQQGLPNYAFFPLYPLLVRAMGGEFALAGMLLSNVAFGCALILLGLVALRAGYTVEDAERTILLLAFFPTSYFCSFPLPEAVFLALTLGSVLGALQGRWWLAGVCGGLAALTRVPGVLLLLPLGVVFLRHERSRLQALWLGLIPLGVGAFMTFLFVRTGNPLAFVAVQTHWQRKAGAFWTPLLSFLRDPSVVGEPWNLIGLNVLAAVLLLLVGIAFVRARRWEWASYTLASLLLPLSSGSLQSLGRYALVVFPVYLWGAVAGRRAVLDRLFLAGLVTVYGWLIALVILRVDFALA
jgi:hypothetical protein